ncbi:MAG: AbrB/MazE/SpoVT family DNA-binding domain-containing protein [Erysipelotrichaceae bacterium]|nr:AbrB/MazE/SpoVT family DNA-binding domain-containing protein [Erysipelotrichaceae bacterium]
MTMRAKLFENGRSQAVRLPKEYRFEGEEVRINKIGDMVILVPLKSKWDNFTKAIDLFSDDFLAEGRAKQTQDDREDL